MVKSQGVEVYLVRHEDNFRYPEYLSPPVSEGARSTSAEAYVEAITGERYAIAFVLTPDFDFRGSPDVKLRCKFGDGWVKVIRSAEEVRTSLCTTGSFSYTMADKPALVDGKWMRHQFSFADLHIDEDAEPTADQVRHDLSSIGQIKVEVSCGTRGALVDFQPIPQLDVAASSKDVVKKNHVSHSTRYTAIAECRQQTHRRSFAPSNVSGYQPISFILRFRSRMSLQLLKIIPDDDDNNYVADTAHHPAHPTADTSDESPNVFHSPVANTKLNSPSSGSREASREIPSLSAPESAGDGRQEQSAAMIKQEMAEGVEIHPAPTDHPMERPIASESPFTQAEKMVDYKLSTPISHGLPLDNWSSASRSSRQALHQQQHAAVKEELDDDLEIVEVRTVPRAQSSKAADAKPANEPATKSLERKRASAALRLELLEVKKRKLDVEREELELKQEMLDLDVEKTGVKHEQ